MHRAEMIKIPAALGLRTIVGGLIVSSLPMAYLKIGHIIIAEAENLIDELAHELEQGMPSLSIRH